LDGRHQLGLSALAAADQFLIGSIVGIAAVAHYAVPMSLVQRSNAIPVAFGRTFFPRMSSLSGDFTWAPLNPPHVSMVTYYRLNMHIRFCRPILSGNLHWFGYNCS
jgi:hypothetical protein